MLGVAFLRPQKNLSGWQVPFPPGTKLGWTVLMLDVQMHSFFLTQVSGQHPSDGHILALNVLIHLSLTG